MRQGELKMEPYRAAVFYKHKEPMKIEYIKPLDIKGEQVLIKTAGCGLCHTDLHIWLGELPGIPEKIPAVLGHEPSGYVVAKGEVVPDYIKIGMPVLIQGGYYVEEDIYTLKGLNQLARKRAQMWTGAYGLYGGCYSEYFVVPSYKYLVSAEGLEDLQAAAVLTDAALTPYKAVKRTLSYIRDYAEADDFVVVVGVGGLGAFGVQWVNRLAPYLNLIAVDIRDEALELVNKVAKPYAIINAKKEDPVEGIRKIVRDKKIMAILDFVGTEATVSTYIKLLSPIGVYTVIGLGGVKGSFSIPDLILNDITILGSLWGSVADLREVVGLARKGMINYRDLVTKRWKLEEINEALEYMHKMFHVGRMIPFIPLSLFNLWGSLA
jgi:propanol-preferring alcohol dehydrogenase